MPECFPTPHIAPENDVINVSVKHDIKRLSRDLTRKQKRDLPRAIVTALNKTAASVKTAVAKDITEATGIANQTVKKYLDIDKANYQEMAATITPTKRTFNLIRFATRAAINAYRKAPGLQAKAWGKKARVFPGVFVGNKDRTAFVRTGKGRLPIKPAYGPSIPRAMASDKIERHTRIVIAERWRKIFDHEFKRLVNRGRR